jgi:NAD(P) transhydrogenase
MSETFEYDLIVIGGGPAGISAANAASILGKKVALVESSFQMGGAGINSGTLPSKTLRETALALSGWHSRELFGVDLSLRRDATISDFMHHYLRIADQERQRLESYLDHFDVACFIGKASFVNSDTIAIEEKDGTLLQISGEIILVATGSVPVRPSIYPFEDDRVHDSDELLAIKTLPKKLAIVGAGVIGSEYASTFAALGVEVHLIDGRSALLPFLDHEIAAALELAMAKKVHFHWKESVTNCDISHPVNVRLTLASGNVMDCDDVLVCAGRSSRTGQLNLEAAGITPGARGIIPVSAHYQTTTPNIYAAGDVIGPPALAATSMEQARVAVCHAFKVGQKCDIAPLLPTGVYTIPEASMVGDTEQTLKAKGVEYVVGRANYSQHPRGLIIGDETGFLKLLFERDTRKLLGVHVIGEHATELVHIGLVAMLTESHMELFNRACFNYPTLGDLYKYATYDALLHLMNCRPEAEE